MKIIITLTFLLSSFLALACEVPDEDPQSVGGPVTDGYNSPNTSGRSGSRSFGGLSSDSSDDASINSDCWGNVVSQGYPGPGWSWAGSFMWTFIGSGGGGGSAVVPSQAKLNYCRRKDGLDKLEAILSATKITSSVMTGLSIAEGSNDFARAYYNTAYQDINRFLTVGMHIDGGPTGIITNWARANINWGQYLSNWNTLAPRRVDNNGNVTNKPQAPNMVNGGLEHIFATHLMTLGLGSGETSDSTAESAAESFLGADPEPNIPC